MRMLKRISCLLVILSAASLFGCAETQVLPMSNRDVIDLDADDVVVMMDCAGFDRERIIEIGPDVRNALAATGAARALVKDRVEAVFTASETTVYVNSRLRGSFVYDKPGRACH
jgi:hypothetical protein